MSRFEVRLREIHWFLVTSLVLLAMLGGTVLFAFDPNRYGFYPVCMFHKITGLFCPGCGSLRALHQLLHGHLVAALRFNALLVLSLPLAGWLALRLVLARFKIEPVVSDLRPVWLWCALALALAFGVLRNLPFAAAAGLAP